MLVRGVACFLLWLAPVVAALQPVLAARRRSSESIEPIYWLHIPKAGSSFATTIAHATCGSRIPSGVVVKEPDEFFFLWSLECPKERFLRFVSDHPPLERRADLMRHTVVMMRRPAQRILSGYFASPERLHDCPSLRLRYHCRRGGRCDGDFFKDDNKNITNPEVISPREYAECVAGCSTRMLTGWPCTRKDTAGEALDVALAVRNLEAAGFVGLTEEWELSVCLWHARFGGLPLRAELSNTRPGPVSTKDYDEAGLLGGWKDPSDGELFEAAKLRFQRELREYGVTRESCTEMLAPVVARSRSLGEVVYVED